MQYAGGVLKLGERYRLGEDQEYENPQKNVSLL